MHKQTKAKEYLSRKLLKIRAYQEAMVMVMVVMGVVVMVLMVLMVLMVKTKAKECLPELENIRDHS